MGGGKEQSPLTEKEPALWMAGSESEVNSSPAVHTKQQLLESFCFTGLLLMNALIPWALETNTEKSHFGTTRHNKNTPWIAEVVSHITRSQTQSDLLHSAQPQTDGQCAPSIHTNNHQKG